MQALRHHHNKHIQHITFIYIHNLSISKHVRREYINPILHSLQYECAYHHTASDCPMMHTYN